MINLLAYYFAITFGALVFSIVWAIYQRHIIEAAITKDQYHESRWHYWGGWVRCLVALIISILSYNTYQLIVVAITAGIMFLLVVWIVSDMVLNMILETKPGIFYRSKKHLFDRVPFSIRFFLLLMTWALILWKSH
jgi:hypothetical protein